MNLSLLQPGSHIVVQTKSKIAGIQFPTLYTHHGIYVGPSPEHPEAFVHWWSGKEDEDGQWASRKESARIRRSNFASFRGTKKVDVWQQTYEECDQPDIVIRRAVKEAAGYYNTHGAYGFFTNNCEHFATWCMTGKRSSGQVDALTRTKQKAAFTGKNTLYCVKELVQSPFAKKAAQAIGLSYVVDGIQLGTEHIARCSGVEPKSAKRGGQVVGFLGHVAIGVRYGLRGGPWGGAFGAVLGAGVWFAKEATCRKT